MTIWQNVLDLWQLWPVRAALILVGALLLNILQRLTLGRLARRARGDMKPWSAAFLKALPTPLALLIWVCAIGWAFRILDRQMAWDLVSFVMPLTGLGIILGRRKPRPRGHAPAAPLQ